MGCLGAVPERMNVVALFLKLFPEMFEKWKFFTEHLEESRFENYFTLVTWHQKSSWWKEFLKNSFQRQFLYTFQKNAQKLIKLSLMRIINFCLMTADYVKFFVAFTNMISELKILSASESTSKVTDITDICPCSDQCISG